MTQLKTPHERFEEEAARYYSSYEEEYCHKVGKAQDDYKAKIHNGFFNALREEYDKLLKSLKDHSRFIIDINDECGEDKSKSFDILLNERYNSLPSEDRIIILSKHSQLKALDKMFIFLGKEQHKYIPRINYISDSIRSGTSSNIKWQGTTELEFVQLIYALQEIGYLKNEENEVTKLVKQVAEAFNYDLGDHWQSNHSESVTSRNTDYEAKIFGKLAKAYSSYRERLIDRKKKNTPK
jgi:hypothetical protein